MSRLIPIVTAILLSSVICSTAHADPDRTLVRIAIADKSSTVTVSGGSRFNVVQAVMQALKKSNRSCTTVSVGTFLQLPAIQPQKSKSPLLTVCLGDQMDGGKSRVYIATSADVPFDVICDVSEGLRKIGYDDVRLLSQEYLLLCLPESK